MKKFKNIKKEILVPKTIIIRDYDKNRCAFECPQLEKRYGNYFCTLFEAYVDKGYDDKVDDYIFLRTKECLRLLNNLE